MGQERKPSRSLVLRKWRRNNREKCAFSQVGGYSVKER